MKSAAVLNFSFGSNMSSARLLARLPNARLVGPARLSGYQMTFNMLSRDGSAKCTIEPADHSREVFGVVYALSRAEKLQLDRIEGERYDCVELPVKSVTGESLEVYSYVANTFVEQQLPFDWYVRHVLSGAREHNFPAHYIGAIDSHPTIQDPDLNRVHRELSIYRK
ncbi:gamma-glutamylcyclotransferase family protein [Pseudoalteromonas sp. T1lg65]|uniref:gamma-glutamylcyclotransferase family protein n=1 Tax=Pseudoalteromonas sp. T1lg65 TaxID=2077101 RepID=UPI003F78B4DB